MVDTICSLVFLVVDNVNSGFSTNNARQSRNIPYVTAPVYPQQFLNLDGVVQALGERFCNVIRN